MKNLAIIAEEIECRHRIRKLLTDFCPEIAIVGEADTISNGFQLITTKRPDAVFLDVALANGTGFDLLDLLPNYAGKIIFLAPSHEFAFKAIKYGALDYILKPVQSKDFSETLEKLRKFNRNHTLHRITLHTHDSLIFVKLKQIVRLEAAGNYTRFYLANNSKLLVTGSLKDYEDLLPAASFFRVHQSHLVRINSIKKIFKQDGGHVEMEDGSLIPISRRKKHDFLEYVQ